MNDMHGGRKRRGTSSFPNTVEQLGQVVGTLFGGEMIIRPSIVAAHHRGLSHLP